MAVRARGDVELAAGKAFALYMALTVDRRPIPCHADHAIVYAEGVSQLGVDLRLRLVGCFGRSDREQLRADECGNGKA